MTSAFFMLAIILLLGYFLNLQLTQEKNEKTKQKQEGLQTQNTNVIWFFRPGCGHCDKMKGAWAKLKQSVLPSNFILQEINTALPENAGISASYQVNGVPHIIKETKGTNGNLNVMVYDGDRSTKSMSDWILNIV